VWTGASAVTPLLAIAKTVHESHRYLVNGGKA
jgi:hypothetical protein